MCLYFVLQNAFNYCTCTVVWPRTILSHTPSRLKMTENNHSNDMYVGVSGPQFLGLFGNFLVLMRHHANVALL